LNSSPLINLELITKMLIDEAMDYLTCQLNHFKQ